MKTNKKLRIFGIGLAIVCCLGFLSQVVERSIDKEGVKNFVTTHLDDSDDGEETINFSEDKDQTFLEFIGF